MVEDRDIGLIGPKGLFVGLSCTCITVLAQRHRRESKTDEEQ